MIRTDPSKRVAIRNHATQRKCAFVKSRTSVILQVFAIRQNRWQPATIIFSSLFCFFAFLPTPALAAIHLSNPNTTSLSQGLVGYWPLDNSVTNWAMGQTMDISGNGNTGQLIGMSTTSSPTPGKIGQALKFNGSPSYIKVSNVSQVSNGAPLTISGWFKTSSTFQGTLIDQKHAGGYIGIEIEANGTLTYYQNDNTFSFCQTTASFSDGRWHFLTAVQPNTNSRQLYIDGVPQCSDPVASDGISGSPALNIGATSGSAKFYQGALDDLRIYNRALSAQEVQQLYNLGTANIAHSNTVALSNGLVGYWTFDGNVTNWTTGQTQDLSGNGKSGQLLGMSTTSSPTVGKIGQGFDFKGSGTISVSSAPIFNASAPFSVSGWFRTTSSAIGELFDEAYPVASTFVFPDISGGNLDVTEADDSGSGPYVSTSGKNYADGAWHHFVLAGQSNGGVRLYVDGSFVVGSGNNQYISYTGTPTLYIGSIRNISHFLKGSMDDIRIYNRALTAGDVAQLYKLGTANIAHSNTVISNGLVGYWTFDGPTVHWNTNTVDDQSGQGNTGQLIGMSTTSSPTPGKIGQAFNFRGSGTVSVSPAPVFNASAPFSVSGWFKTTNSSLGYLFQEQYSSHGAFVQLDTYSGNLEVTEADDTGSGPYIFKAGNYADGAWHHFVVTGQSNGSDQLYVDGTFAAGNSDSNAYTNYTGTPTFYIGSYSLGGFLTGSMDDVRIYNRALSAQEVQQLYSAGR